MAIVSAVPACSNRSMLGVWSYYPSAFEADASASLEIPAREDDTPSRVLERPAMPFPPTLDQGALSMPPSVLPVPWDPSLRSEPPRYITFDEYCCDPENGLFATPCMPAAPLPRLVVRSVPRDRDPGTFSKPKPLLVVDPPPPPDLPDLDVEFPCWKSRSYGRCIATSPVSRCTQTYLSSSSSHSLPHLPCSSYRNLSPASAASRRKRASASSRFAARSRCRLLACALARQVSNAAPIPSLVHAKPTLRITEYFRLT